MNPGLCQRLRAARAEAARACEMLLAPTPEALDRSARCWEAFRVEMLSGPFPSRIEALALPDREESLRQARQIQKDLRRAHALLEEAWQFHENWIHRLGAMTAGYTDHGLPAEVTRAGHFLARG